jgi:hypothetical protein
MASRADDALPAHEDAATPVQDDLLKQLKQIERRKTVVIALIQAGGAIVVAAIHAAGNVVGAGIEETEKTVERTKRLLVIVAVAIVTILGMLKFIRVH